MPTFRYRGYSANGSLLEGEIEASNKDEAEDALWRRGLTPFETREVKVANSGMVRRRFSFGSRAPNMN